MNESNSTPIASGRCQKSESRQHIKKTGRTTLSQMYSASPTHREPSSPDMLGKLSLALNNVRNLKVQLAEREEELRSIREEKEKYQSEHGRLYSQLTAIRTRSSIFEGQLAKKATENTELCSKNAELETECSKLRQIIADDTSKQTQRIKQLELQLNTLKSEIIAITSGKKCNVAEHESKEVWMQERIKLLAEIDELHKNHLMQMRDITNENNSLQSQIATLMGKLEELRATNTKISSEKIGLQHDLDRIKQEHSKYLKINIKNSACIAELEERLAEVETERTNAKMALKKAIAILDAETALRQEIASKDGRISELEKALEAEKIRIHLPSFASLEQSGKAISPVSMDEPPRYVEDISAGATTNANIPNLDKETKTCSESSSPNSKLQRKLAALAETKARMRKLMI